jgi:hypothetical protein
MGAAGQAVGIVGLQLDLPKDRDDFSRFDALNLLIFCSPPAM